MIIKILQNLGIDESKARTYLAALELGTAKATKIADKAGLKRTTIYDNIDKLKKIGLLTEIKNAERAAYYRAADPETIETIMQQRTEEIRGALPELKALYQGGNTFRPNIRMYEGSEGFKSVLTEIVEKSISKVVRIFQSKTILEESSAEYLQFMKNITDIRIKNQIRTKTLREKSSFEFLTSIPDFLAHESDTLLREVRYLPYNLTMYSLLYIWDKKVAIISAKMENYAVIIESEDYAKTMEQFFDTMWDSALLSKKI